MDEIAAELRQAFPNVDIRSDQCPLIRMILPTLMIGISMTNTGYEAKVVSFVGDFDFDFETKLLEVIQSSSIDDLKSRISRYIPPE